MDGFDSELARLRAQIARSEQLRARLRDLYPRRKQLAAQEEGLRELPLRILRVIHGERRGCKAGRLSPLCGACIRRGNARARRKGKAVQDWRGEGVGNASACRYRYALAVRA